jgi:Uma2 family endonuclease
MSRTANQLSLQEFLDLPESDERFELVDGELILKMAPKTPHSRVQKRLLRLIDDWCEQTHLGEVNPEWTVVLKRHGVDWAPVPDLTYISWSRVSADWNGEGPCPGIPELVVEVISPGQTFGEMTQKATDYLLAGVDQIWIVDTKAQAVTVFERDRLPQTFWVDSIISTPLLPDFLLKVADLFPSTARRT